MAFFNKIKAVVQTEGARGIRQVLQKEGTKRFAQDLSANLAVDDLAFCETRRYGLPALISSIAVDPVQGLLACGTFKGAIAVTGAPDVTGYLELEEAVSVKLITFQPGAPVLIVIDAKNAITVFDLIKRQRLFVRNARSVVTCMELLSGSNWLFHGLKDGTIDVFDVYKGQPVAYRIPNILPEGPKHSLVVSIKAHPRDNNQLLIAYNTGIALWNLKQKTVIRTFIYEIPPGAMGGIAASEDMFGINERRYPHVTVISWKPDGLGFVSGYDDGCFVFWDVRQEMPILARTIHELQVNVPGIRPVFERNAAQFVPIYQLCWCLHANKEDTTLIVAGGTNSIDMFGLHLFEYPAKGDYRSPRRQHMLTMDSDILDFTVLARDSPWFNGALDPTSILVLTNRGGLKSFSFDAPHAPQTVPSCLAFVEPRLIFAKMYGQLPHDLYDRLVYGQENQQRHAVVPRIPLRGIHLAPVDETKLCRDVLVTAHADSSVRFWEAASLRPLHHLTVELGPLFFKNQGDIVALEYSIHSQVLAMGFSNGNWIYGRLSGSADLSRQSSIVRMTPEEPIDGALAADLQEAMSFSAHDMPVESNVLSPIPEQISSPPSDSLAPQRHPQYRPVTQEDTVSPHADMGVISTPSQVQYHVNGPHELLSVATNVNPSAAGSSEALSPNAENLDYLVPFSPVDPVKTRDSPDSGLNPDPPLPERVPSPSLPPRPTFVEVSLPNGSEFSPVYKSSAHLGKINQIAISACGLVAVSDEFYALSIADTVSGRVLHVEDLKVVMLDRDKTINNNEAHGNINQDSEQVRQNTNVEQGQVDPQSLQRVGVVITSLQFVVSTTSDQDKVPSLLLIAGSTNGIYMIFAIFTSESHPSQPSSRYVRKAETFQTKEQHASVHTSIINVISPSESAAGALKSTTSISSVSSAATSSTVSTAFSDPATQLHPPPLPSQQQLSPQPPLQRRSEDGSGFAQDHRSSLSETSSIGGRSDSGSSATKPSIYSTWKEAQGKVMSKAHQRLNYLVCVSELGLRLHMNCTSRRINKVHLTSPVGENGGGLFARNGRIMAANVVYHGGACCILCITESGRVLLFSVPKLELIPLPVPGGELQLPIVLEPERLRESVILPDGRIFVPILKYEFRMYSLWGHDRWIQTAQGWKQERSAEMSPYVQLYDHSIQIPPRPTQVTAQASKGWFGMGHIAAEDSPSQEDLDELFGGEHYRAENPILKRAGVQGPPGVSPQPPHKVGASADANTTGLASMMGQTLQGLDERGKKLNDLGDKTAEMSSAGNDFLTAARELNARNANKKWYEF